MEVQQRLWKGDSRYPTKQVKSKRRRNQHRKHSVTKKNNADLRDETGYLVKSSNSRTKHVTVSSKNDTKSPKSFGNVDSRLTSSMQVFTHKTKPLPSDLASSSRVSSRSSRRPHTSLGFAWNKSSSTPSHALGPPQGFDIADYVRRHGTARDIQIGINGIPVNDKYFQAYLEECERELGKDEEYCSSGSDENFDLSYLTTASEGRLLHHQVPLCWEDQLKTAKVSTYQYTS